MENEELVEQAKLDFEKVQKEKLILKGDDVQNGIDYTHFNFLVHTNHDAMSDILEDETKSAFDVLKFFWEQFYPYLDAEVKDKESLFGQFGEVNRDADDTVKLGMEFKFKLDHAEAIINQSGKMLWNSYQKRLETASNQLHVEMLRQQEQEELKNG